MRLLKIIGIFLSLIMISVEARQAPSCPLCQLIYTQEIKMTAPYKHHQKSRASNNFHVPDDVRKRGAQIMRWRIKAVEENPDVERWGTFIFNVNRDKRGPDSHTLTGLKHGSVTQEILARHHRGYYIAGLSGGWRNQVKGQHIIYIDYYRRSPEGCCIPEK